MWQNFYLTSFKYYLWLWRFGKEVLTDHIWNCFQHYSNLFYGNNKVGILVISNFISMKWRSLHQYKDIKIKTWKCNHIRPPITRPVKDLYDPAPTHTRACTRTIRTCHTTHATLHTPHYTHYTHAQHTRTAHAHSTRAQHTRTAHAHSTRAQHTCARRNSLKL